MHPLLAHPKGLRVYLAAWMVPGGILLGTLWQAGGLTGAEAAAMAVPLCFFYAFVCLSTWYVCRAFPPRADRIWGTVAALATAAAACALVWTGFASVLAAFLERLTAFSRLEDRFRPDLALVFGLGVAFALLSVAFHYILIALQGSREAEARAMQARLMASDAELKALKAQINPHFLFNSLNSISTLTTVNPGEAREMCVLLGDFLRRTLGLGEKDSISLDEELSLIRTYLQVERVRYGSRLRFAEEVSAPALGCLLPPLLLQPLVENAVSHGIASLLEGGEIRLRGERTPGYLRLSVENSFDPDAPPRRRHGMGLKNVRRRLETRYGREARMEAGPVGGEYHVWLALPMRSEEAS